jgi:glycosyltransferase involved in cell wall biosynthesis
MSDFMLIASIVIPMRNEEKYIERCLDSVLANTVPHEQFEIIVVDGDSTDRSRELVIAKAAEFSCIRLLRNPKQTVSPGLNLAISQSTGRYIIRLDAHSVYPPDYIAKCIDELQRTGAAVVGGRCITRPGAEALVAKAVAFATQNPICVGNSAYRIGVYDRYVDTVPFGAFRREIFNSVGLFREDLVRHQDYELNARIRKAGERIYLSRAIFVTYYNVPTFSKFIRQGYTNGLWEVRAWL